MTRVAVPQVGQAAVLGLSDPKKGGQLARGVVSSCASLAVPPIHTSLAEPRLSGRVVIVEDQRLVADLFAAHCEKLGLQVVALAKTLQEAYAAVRRLEPDLLMTDFSLPDGDGLQGAVKLMGEFRTMRVIGLSSHRDPWTMLQVQRSGIHGFVDKNDQRPDVLTEAIVAVMHGRTFYTQVVGQSSAVLRHDRSAFVHVLSDYELRVLALIGEAKDDVEIGNLLGISASTAQSRRRDIMRKLDIHSTPKLIHYALAQGIVRTDHLSSPGST
jgi:DNA-binding NarL/FixJ family response regulator